MASLPLLIYQELTNPEAAGPARVWGAALTLILLIAAALPGGRGCQQASSRGIANESLGITMAKRLISKI